MNNKQPTPRGFYQRHALIRHAAHLGLYLALLAAGPAGCGEAGAAFGTSPAAARSNADALFLALGSRLGPVEWTPSYKDALAKLAHSALVPSRLFNDRNLWSASHDETRELEVGGGMNDAGYLLGVRDVKRPPREPGDYRRLTRLRNVADRQYEWTVRDELVVGTVSPDELGAVLGSLLSGVERGDARAVRASYRAALPRTTDALSRLFTLDSIALAPALGGGTLVSIITTTHPNRVAGEFPLFSRFLGRYVTPTRLDFVASDLNGVRWWRATLDRGRFTLRLRVKGGRLAPLEGPSRVMPDRLRVHAEMATRIRIFNIGLSELVADVELSRAREEKGFTARFRREPEWHLPPLVERLIRAPLRRPFEEEGAFFALLVRQSDGRTTLRREYQLAVHESAIVRWLGDLGSTAVDDFRMGAEREYDRFNGELFAALRADAAALIR